MSRSATGILTLGLALAAARGARAQQIFYLGSATTDTAVGLLPGVEVQLPVRATNPNGYYYYLYSARLTFHYDPAAIEILGALPDGLYITDSATTSGSFTVSGTGCVGGTDVGAFKLRVRLKPGAPSGAYVWATADTTQLWYYCYYGAPFVSDFTVPIGQVCASTTLYGDVDGNLRVESRDALIALSAAVGLPVSGFNLANGDVDGDGLTNSRDALMMLSYSIGLPIYSANRVAQGVPASCPALTPAGEAIVFRRPGSGGTDTLFSLAAAATAGVPIPNTTGVLANPRLAADGVSIVFGCKDLLYNYYDHICRIQTDGSAFADLTPGGAYYDYYDVGPDWSPDGTKIAFRNNYYPCYRITMDSSGANQIPVGSSYCGSFIAWSRTGAQLAYPTDGSGLRIVNSNGTGDAPVTTGFSDQQMIRWSPAGDSIGFTRYGDGLYAVPAAGGTSTRVLAFPGLNYTNGFDWGPQGILFSLTATGRSGIWLLPSLTGPIYRVTGGNDRQPSFRRNP
jgi:Tol biopolymer transport system component